MDSAKAYQPITIKGTLQVLDWSKSREVQTIGVVDGYDDEYVIVMDGSSKPLMGHLWESVSIQGLVDPDRPYHIHVLSFQIIDHRDYLNGTNRLV